MKVKFASGFTATGMLIVEQEEIKIEYVGLQVKAEDGMLADHAVNAIQTAMTPR